VNLIPNQSEKSLSYWCSWHTQNIVAMIDNTDKFPADIATAMKSGENGAMGARMMMNEDLIFGSNGYAHQYAEVRGDMYLMLDDGWDVDYGINPDAAKCKFGSLIMSEERFPSVKGKSPAQRLKLINDKAKAFGWRGIGIWVAAQRSAEDYEAPFGEADLPYWRERILWSREAGVEYWKVDWGTQQDNHHFRRTLTELGRELYPQLVIEHATCMAPLNAFEHGDPAGEGRYESMSGVAAHAKEGTSYSEVYRSYDVLNAMAVPTTLDRLAWLLKWSRGYVNGEDECTVNAALGCSIGVMRSHYCRVIQNEADDDRGWRLDEVTAAIRWQRLAPAFAGTNLECSEEILFDHRYYHRGDSWTGWVDEKEVRQGAPAVMARNLPVSSIRVDAEIKPFVAASLNPSGAYTVAALPRVVGKRLFPRATLHCHVPAGVDTIGLFGANTDFCLHLAEAPAKVYVQSLIGDEALELTEGVEGSTVTITADLAQKVFGGRDHTAPALVLGTSPRKE
jgi:hypothetical protein